MAALEQAKVLGNLDNPEELLASITGKVHQRQLIRQQQAAAAKTGKVQVSPKAYSNRPTVCSWIKRYLRIKLHPLSYRHLY